MGWLVDANLDASITPTITPVTPTWDSSGDGADYGYTISGANLPQATTVDLDYAGGTTVNTVLGAPIVTTTTATTEGTYDLNATPAQLGTPPPGATDLLVVADPGNLITPADPNKVAFLTLADVTLDSVSTTDSREAIVDYDVHDPTTPSFYIQIYRSDRPTFQSNATHVAVSVPFAVDNPQPGGGTVTIPLSSPAPNEASPVEPLAPDPALPYVLAVVVDANGNVPTDLAVDESEAHFEIYIIGAVSVGFQLGVTDDNAPPPDWVDDMADALGPEDGNGYSAVIPFGWASGKLDSQAVYRAGTALYNDIVQAAQGLSSQLEPNDVIDVHLIGHSRGSVVIDLAMNQLLAAPPDEQLAHGYYKLTFLDPHPANAQTIPDSSTASSLLFLAYSFFELWVHDPSIEVPARVNQVEEYYEQNAITSLSSATELVSKTEYALNLTGDPSQITIDDPIGTLTNIYNLSSLGLGHSEVHDYYMEFIVPTLVEGGIDPSVPAGSATSGSTSPVNIQQTLEQALYPHLIDDQGEADDLTVDLSMAYTDVGQGNYSQALGELQAFDTAAQAAPAADFTSDSDNMLVSTIQGLIGDLGSTDIANISTSTADGPTATATANANDPANNQQVSGTLTTGSQFSGAAQFSVANYTQDPNANPAGQVSAATFDVQAVGIDPTAQAGASVTFTGQIPTQQLQQAALSYFTDNGQWQTIAEYTGSGWVQVGPSGSTAIQEVDSPVSGTNMSNISLSITFGDNTSPAIDDLGGTVFALTVPAPISLSPLPGGTVGASYDQTIVAGGGTGNKSLVVTGVSGSIAGLPIPTGGTNSLSISGTPTAAGTVSFTVQATDSTGLEYSQKYTLTVSTADPSRSKISLTPSTIVAGATATVTLTAVDTSGLPATAGGLSVQFGLGTGSGAGTFSSVSDNGNGTYTAVFTGVTAGSNTITATINGQPVTTQAPTIAVTPGPADLTQSTISATAAALPVGGTTTVTLTARDADGNQESTGDLPVTFGVTSAVGTFGPVTDNDNGTYTAIFTASSAGSATFTATINGQQVASPPTGIVVVPLSLAFSTVTVMPPTIEAGAAAPVTLTAVDTDDSQETTGGLTVVFTLGSGTGTGTFGPVTDNGNGTYSATFTAATDGTNTISATMDGFAITTAAPITVTGGSYLEVASNPTSQVVSAGNPVALVAAASGSPAPTVQWQVSTDGGNTFSNLAGATSTTLTFNTTAAENGNEYQAVFTNSFGTATTAPAMLTVNATPGGLVISATSGVFPQFSLAPPPQVPSGGFSGQAVTLSNGNIVMTVSGGVGAVCLYNGETGALISTLLGASSVTALTNGNFVAVGSNSATWCSGTTGLDGTVSASNSLIAGGAQVIPQITPLTNGNYVIDWEAWNGGTGAVTWGNGTTGTIGTVSAVNSLIGDNFGDYVGGRPGYGGGVTALPDGNYVVGSPNWNITQGAVTWGNGTTGATGTVSADNSLVGTQNDDEYNCYLGSDLVVLANGDYVVYDSSWNNREGEATWGNEATGISGVISAANSLIGSTPGVVGVSNGDNVGVAVVPLANGNYVVGSPAWNNDAGAVTWGNGTTGVSGIISASNSLIGPSGAAIGSNNGYFSGNLVTALTNGNYVVASPDWDGYVGAVTWGNGTTGTTGTVSAGNSLVGSNNPENWADRIGISGVTALANGNYVVSSPLWNYQEGAVTWGNGTTGTTGVVSAGNSLVGSQRTGGFYDSVGGGVYLDPSHNDLGTGGVTALTNGNYVVDSPDWDGDTGAVTWGSGETGTSGIVASTNSLVGSYSEDYVGVQGVTVLSNGNYVVDSSLWNNSEGAVTWANGMQGITGAISASNSLVGSLPGDQVGGGIWNRFGDGYTFTGGVSSLSDGNYVVLSPFWNNDGAAATWGNGTQGTSGILSSGNSLTGFPEGNGGTDGVFSVTLLPNSNYLVNSIPPDPTATQGNFVTWVDGATGSTIDGNNTPEAQNSFGFGGVAPIPSAGSFIYFGGGSSSPAMMITDPNDLTYGLGLGRTITVAPSFLTGDLDAGTDVTIQSNDDITIDSPINESPTGSAGSLTLEAGRSILVNASIKTASGNLSLIANDSLADGVVNSERDPGNADITMTSGANLDTGSGLLTVDLEYSTDKTNNGRGSIILLGVNANAFTFPAGSTLAVSINGTTPGDGITAGTYSQLDVSGSINLNNATLQVAESTAVAAGSALTIVQGGSGVSGTFNGLPPGSVVVANDGSEYTISYRADNGLAVVLTALGIKSPPPTVTSVSPAAGPTAGGMLETITGSGFTDVTAVDFGTTAAADVTVVNSTTIMAYDPPGTGVVNVIVTTPVGTTATSAADQFTYVVAPTVTGLSATGGPAAGGTLVTITGTNFIGATAVGFGNLASTDFTVLSSTTITADSPAGTGLVNVVVTTSGGTSATSSADQFTYIAAPVVTGVSPTSGPGAGGTLVTITGTNFTGATAVAFGTAAATDISVVNSTTIMADDPAGTGVVNVTVTTPGGTSATSSADQFTYIAAPAVTDVSPTSGPLAGGTLVKITGTSFTGATAVDFGTAAATEVTLVNSTTITADSPAGSGVVDVRVTTPGGTSATSSADQFTYVVAPTVSGLSPGSGPTAGDSLVTVTGTNFTGATAVDFGAKAATNITLVNSTTITADSPAGSGVVDVTVTTPGGTSATSSADQFTYVVAPAVTSLSPTSGPTNGGTLVTITGTNLTGATAVGFGTTSATNITVVSSTTITADSPAGTGIVDFTVTTPGGRSATSSADQFTYVAAPAVSDLSPTSGPLAGGTLVTITGTNFTGATAVDFGATAATDVTVVNSATITADSPAGTGTVNVTVTTAGGTSAISASDQFTYLVVPAVTGLSPASGPAAGGTSVTITGTGFTVGSIVDFATTAATDVAVVNSTTITADSPAGSGVVNVTVTTAGGTSAASAADQFTYIAAPAVTGLSPSTGPVAGGTSVTVTGTNFTGATAVDFGTAAAADVVVVNSTTITADNPAGAGVVNVTVTTAGGTSATSAADQFTYLAAPAVTGLSPTSGPSAGGTLVTITGTSFTGATTVDFGTSAATNITVVNNTTITADSPAGSGVVNVAVTTPFGTSATSAADQFSYVVAPTVTGLSPTSGPVAGGTLVTITGTSFTGATAVDFGTMAATNIAVVSSTTITADSPAGTGLVNVVVTTSGGTSATSSADQFTYIAAPVVTGVSPTSGPGAGGTLVTITGTNFTGATAVAFGTAAATDISVVNSTTIMADDPAGTGVVNVTVTTPGGTSATSSADQFTYIAAPAVTDVSPTSGPLAGGTLVKITGTSFTGATAVDFGTAAATEVTLVNSTTITADSPAGSGVVDVRVTTPGGTSATSSADQFTYVVAPTVSGLSPGSGPTAGDSLVTVTGTNFTGATAVDFGAKAATNITLVNSTTITADSPAGSGVVDVTVTTPGGTSATSSADQFTYVVAPAVTSLSPTSGPTNGGTLVTITGTNLTGATAVGFGTTSATNITVVSSTTITADSPAGTGIVDFTVTTPGGRSATSSADQFTYVAAPAVSDLSPTSGPLAGGTLVTITGTNFTGATAVDFGATAATDVTVVNSATITADSPAGTGTVNVTVTTAGGTSAISASDQFTYLVVPAVTGLSPASGPAAGGTSVTITGTGFTVGSIVDFATTAATDVAVVNSTTITADSPAGSGVVNVTVTTAGGTSAASAADQFTYIAAPAVTGLSPSTGPVAGGTSVTVTGTNFTGATAVDFGTAAAADVVVVNSTTITADNPAGAGVVNVTVTTAGGTSATSAADQFTYLAAPAVTGLSPTSGPSAGGTLVTITGTSFTGATTVDFGTSAATNITVVNNTTITADSPAGSGVVNVAVTTPFGTSATSAADQFSYVVAPTVTGLSPTSGPVAGGTLVTITGTSFTGATAVDFGTMAATNIAVVSSTTITADSPARTGTVDVTVTTPGGKSGNSSADKFTYIAAPAVSELSPTSGPAAGGTLVTITGTNLAGATAVDFGTAAATNITVVNSTTITADSPAGSGVVDVTVATPGVTSAKSSADEFTYVVAPAVTGLSPTSGPAAGGSLVTITGANLTGPTAVDFGTTAATNITVVSSTTITADSPAGAGIVDVTVNTPAGRSATSSADQFTYVPGPAVSDLSPTSGPLAGGTLVTITGTNLAGATAVDFGATAATNITVVSSTTITADSPAGTGTVNVTVTTTGGTSATSAADQFTYFAAPTVSGLSPASGPVTGGTLVTVTGASFTGATEVDFGTTAATDVTVVNSTTITADSPAGSGVVNVSVTTPGGKSAASAADQFTYIAAPGVTGLSPTTGPAAGGTLVTISGANFTGATAVDFGTTAATNIKVVNSATITADSSAGTGIVDVTVTTPGGSSVTSVADRFTYIAAPVVSGLSPGSGPTGGAMLVTITGANFTGATSVDFGAAAATDVTVVNSDAITAVSPTGSGVVSVTVTTPGGTSASSAASQFAYVAVSAVTGLSPTSGSAAGGTLVTITGTGFTGATAIEFGTAAATNIAVLSSTTITADSPAGTGGVNVTVTTPGGESADSAAGRFTYVGQAANLSSVSGVGTSGGTATLSSTLTASDLPLAGRTVIFTLNEAGTVMTVGSATTDANGVATLTGVSLAGIKAGAYPGAVGATFAGDSTYSGSMASGTLTVNPLAPPVIVGEKALFNRKTNKKGRPIGKPVLDGFVLDFSGPLNPTSATTRANYQLDTVTTKRVKKQTQRVLHPITSFSVAYSAANDSVTLTFAGKQTFRTGGQLTVVSRPPGGVTGESGATLAENSVFNISARGKKISPT